MQRALFDLRPMQRKKGAILPVMKAPKELKSDQNFGFPYGHHSLPLGSIHYPCFSGGFSFSVVLIYELEWNV